MLKFDLKRIAEKRGYGNVNEYLRKNGIEVQKAWRLGSGRMKKWDVRDIEKLCLVFRCTPDDLFVYTPVKDKNYDETQPLNKLTRADESLAILNYLKSKSMDEIRELENELAERKKGK